VKEEIKGFSLNYVELMEYQQNRYPYLMIDGVDEVIPGKSAKGFKNLTNNEWFFPPHFPDAPNMPGALQLESFAQMLTIAVTTMPGNKGKFTRFISNTMKYHKEIVPGDKMIIETEITFYRRGLFKGTGKAYTNGELASEATMVICIPDIFEQFLPPEKTNKD
jgi:3-hydroxyacyl-[acyl-carrier-protein] dehydratase